MKYKCSILQSSVNLNEVNAQSKTHHILKIKQKQGDIQPSSSPHNADHQEVGNGSSKGVSQDMCIMCKPALALKPRGDVTRKPK